MKRILLSLLGIIIVLGLFGAAGYAGYRFGYSQGVRTTADADMPRFRPFDEFHPRGIHPFGMDREFQRGFGPGRFPMRGFGFFFPFWWVAPLAVLALSGLLVYWLIARSGWRLTRQTSESAPPPPQPEPPRPPENE